MLVIPLVIFKHIKSYDPNYKNLELFEKKKMVTVFGKDVSVTESSDRELFDAKILTKDYHLSAFKNTVVRHVTRSLVLRKASAWPHYLQSRKKVLTTLDVYLSEIFPIFQC